MIVEYSNILNSSSDQPSWHEIEPLISNSTTDQLSLILSQTTNRSPSSSANHSSSSSVNHSISQSTSDSSPSAANGSTSSSNHLSLLLTNC